MSDERRKPWTPQFPCGHRKRRPSCAVCVELRRPASRPLEERFWEKVDKRGPDECWPWVGAVDKVGYSQMYWNGRVQNASRISWFIANGKEMPAELYACHTCDTPRCVNPNHIFAGTPSDNQRDCVGKGRNHSPQKLTDGDLSVIREQFAHGRRAEDIGNDFSVSATTIRRVIRGVYPYRDKRSA